MTDAHATLDALLQEVTEPLGFEVICWEWAGQGKYRVLRLYLDRSSDPAQPVDPAAPVRSEVSLEDCASVSRLVGLRIEAAETQSEWAGVAGQFKAPYTLEVSSPGIERPLTKVAHFQRFVGKRAAIRCDRDLRPGEARKKFSGPLVGVAEDGPEPRVRLMDEELRETVDIPMSSIRKAHLLFEGV